jgi:hypothetical protein
MHRVGESNHRLWSRIGVFLSGLPEHASENKAVLDEPSGGATFVLASNIG